MLGWRDSAVALGLVVVGTLVLNSALFFHMLTLNTNSSWIFSWAGHLWFLAIPLIWYFALKKRFPIGNLSANSLKRWLPGWILILVIVVPIDVLTFQRTSFAGFTSLAIVMNLLFNAVLVGLSEEFLFRGLVQTGINNSVEKTLKLGKGSVRLGTILAALVFAAIHLQDISSIPFAFVFGIIAGHYYDKTNNIWGAVIIHNIVDLLSFIVPVVL
jgi:membrane protease YdiL (CAAX protease family)